MQTACSNLKNLPTFFFFFGGGGGKGLKKLRNKTQTKTYFLKGRGIRYVSPSI